MQTVKEIERAIGALTLDEVQELDLWLEHNYPQPIDARVQTDLAAGSLDKAIQRALDEEKNGPVRQL